MISIPLDPHLLAIDGADQQRALLLTESILRWSALRDHPYLTLCITDRTLEALSDDGKLPVYTELIRALSAVGVDYADAYTVAQAVAFFVGNITLFESAIGISDILFGQPFTWADTCECPAIPKTCAERKRMLGLAALRQQLGWDGQIRLAQQSVHRTAQVHIHGTIELAELAAEPPPFPVNVDQLVTACSDVEAILATLNAVNVWQEINTADGMLFAIRVAAEQIRGNSAVSQVQIGGNFIDSATSFHFDQDTGKASRLLSACAEVAVGCKLNQVHAIRTSKTGNAKQLRRGTAKAWRKDIDHDFHLHYWQLESGLIRLASVAAHSDFSIRW
jgi:hypothetical protein